MGMGTGGNGNDFMGVGGNGNSKSHSRTPLVRTFGSRPIRYANMAPQPRRRYIYTTANRKTPLI